MKKIVVASSNPVKAEAVLHGFERMFPKETFSLHSLEVASQVSEQPMSDAETRLGAFNRALAARQTALEADYWAGVEGGVEYLGEDLTAFAWIVVLSYNQQGMARTGTFMLPPEVVCLIDSGLELGEADDIVFGKKNSKQAAGAVGLLTNNAMTRSSFYAEAVVLALIPFRNPELCPDKIAS